MEELQLKSGFNPSMTTAQLSSSKSKLSSRVSKQGLCGEASGAAALSIYRVDSAGCEQI